MLRTIGGWIFSSDQYVLKWFPTEWVLERVGMRGGRSLVIWKVKASFNVVQHGKKV